MSKVDCPTVTIRVTICQLVPSFNFSPNLFSTNLALTLSFYAFSFDILILFTYQFFCIIIFSLSSVYIIIFYFIWVFQTFVLFEKLNLYTFLFTKNTEYIQISLVKILTLSSDTILISNHKKPKYTIRLRINIYF